MASDPSLPIVYSCSGCSNVAQLANDIAVRLDRAGEAEMSCIVGVGGDVPSLVKVATSGRPVVAIDGCPLACVRHTLARHGVTPDVHHLLNEYGFKKRAHMDIALDDEPEIYEAVRASLPDALAHKKSA